MHIYRGDSYQYCFKPYDSYTVHLLPCVSTIMDSVSGTINQNIFYKFLLGMVFYHCNRNKNKNTLRYKVQQDPKQEKPALLFDNLLYCSTRNESTHTGHSQLHKSDITQSPSIADHLWRFLHLSRPPHWGAGDQTSSMCKMSRREASRHGIEGPFVSQRTT